ncbi:MAG: prolipoprotein diacylglyceryl transferase [Chitinophagales bacterium]|nr:prolipoprotein diacylglyceryl transferase [Saprospirales bacterium]MBP6659063.1 prolipoprotein diacylglyceryl transferase [Chitinophagales bacterium]
MHLNIYWLSVLSPLVIAFLLFAKFNFREFKPFSYYHTAVIIISVVVFGYFGSRIGHVIQYNMLFKHNVNSVSSFIHSFFYDAGYKLPIGYLFSFLTLIAVNVYFDENNDYLRALDKFALFASFVSIFGNLGCFFDGHHGCRGTETSLPWGCYYTFTKLPSTIPLHPMQLYSVFLMTIIFLWMLFSKQRKYGEKFIISLLIVDTYNFFIDPIRERFTLFYNISFCQIIYFLNILVLLFIYFRFVKSNKIIDRQNKT